MCTVKLINMMRVLCRVCMRVEHMRIRACVYWMNEKRRGGKRKREIDGGMVCVAHVCLYVVRERERKRALK